MKVILSKEVPKLGHTGDVKEVSDGFARNFLLARGLAKPATAVNIQTQQKEQAGQRVLEEKEQASYKKLAEDLQNTELRFNIKVGDKGQAFGSITAQDIAEKLSEDGVKIDRRWIELEHGIKTTGEHGVKVKLPHQIESAVKVVIEAESQT